jgi:mevalonate kinase
MVEETQKIVTARDKVMEQFKKYTDDLVEHLEKYVSNKTTIISEKQLIS